MVHGNILQPMGGSQSVYCSYCLLAVSTITLSHASHLAWFLFSLRTTPKELQKATKCFKSNPHVKPHMMLASHKHPSEHRSAQQILMETEGDVFETFA